MIIVVDVNTYDMRFMSVCFDGCSHGSLVVSLYPSDECPLCLRAWLVFYIGLCMLYTQLLYISTCILIIYMNTPQEPGAVAELEE